VNKNELVNLVSERIEGGKAAATNAVDAVFEAIQETVSRGEKVAITGFGVFEKVERAARTGRNPATGESVQVKASSVPKFRPGTQFKAYVSGAQGLVREAVDIARSTAVSGVRAATGQLDPSGASTTSDSPSKAATTAAPTQSTPAKATAAQSTPAKATPSKSTPAKSSGEKSSGAKSTPAKATSAKPSAAKSSAAKSTPTKATAAKSAAAKATAAKATATKSTADTSTANKSTGTTAAKKTAAKAPAKAPAKKSTAKKSS